MNKILSIIAGALAIVTVAGVLVPLTKRGASSGSGSGGGNFVTTSQGVYGQRMNDYASLYEQEGLTACYMGYDTSTLTYVRNEETREEHYTWRNYVKNGQDAVLTTVTQWQGMAGGIGYDIVYKGEGPYNERARCNIPYDLSFDTMENFEVEVVASFRGLTDKEGNRVFLTKDEDADGEFKSATSFRFGELHACGYLTGSYSKNFNYQQRWYISNQHYGLNGHFDVTTDKSLKLYDDYGLGVFNNWEGRDDHAICMSVRRGGNSNGYIMTVEYSYAGDVFTSNSNATSDTLLDDALVTKLSGVAPTDPSEEFTLFDGYPGIMYGVRVYDHELTEKTRLRNAFVDYLAFYRINVSAFFTLTDADLDTFLEACGRRADKYGVVIDPDDAASGWSNRSLVYDIIDECWPG